MALDATGTDDRRQFEEWFATAHRIAMRTVRDPSAAEDLAQSALKRLWGLEELPRNPSAWLQTTIRNLATDRYRRDLLRPEARELEDHVDPNSLASLVVRRAGIRDALDQLSPRHREALLLSAAGYTNAEIAQELGFGSPESVAATLSRLRRQLRQDRDSRSVDLSDQANEVRNGSPSQAPEAHNEQQGAQVIEVPAEVASRIRREPETTLHIVPGSTPVPFFGQQPTARLATVGINPSSAEFLSRGRELDGARRRFETLNSLGISSISDADDDHVAAIYQRCMTYFHDLKVAYWSWFRRLENIIQPLAQASYLDGSACHLDLIQWATRPVWSNIKDPEVKRKLAAEDPQFLLNQLAAPQLKIAYLNGRQVAESLGKFIKLDSRTVKFREGKTRTFWRGCYEGTFIVGSSVFLSNSYVRAEDREAFDLWIAEECRKDLDELGCS